MLHQARLLLLLPILSISASYVIVIICHFILFLFYSAPYIALISCLLVFNYQLGLTDCGVNAGVAVVDPETYIADVSIFLMLILMRLLICLGHQVKLQQPVFPETICDAALPIVK